MKLHKNLVAAVMEALETSFGKGYYADKVIERLLKTNRKWGARDRGFIAESTYEIVRWWRLLWELYGREPTLKRKELYKIFGIWWKWNHAAERSTSGASEQGGKLPQDWNQFKDIHNFDIKKRLAEVPQTVGVQQSFPEWLDELAQSELGEKWPEAAAALNIPAEVILRTNTLKISREELQNVLLEEGVETEIFSQNEVGLILKKRQNTFRKPSFQEGYFEVQDGGSQLIAPLLDVKAGMRVIDACAGAGGKTLHLAALMENKGNIIAMDTESWKLNELKKRAKRAGAHNIETRPIENSKTIKRLEASADRLLLDVPCSGTGVLKRNPDTKWKLQPEHLERVKTIQQNILKDYSKMLKKGGKMVYATCSILRSENEEQIALFLKENDGFALVEEKRIWPSGETDGFFVGVIKRSE